jgi:glycosyltransferase involved in cell wall biosynthesis
VKDILTNSQRVKTLVSEAEKVDSSMIHVIYNGIEKGISKSDRSSKGAAREELGIPKNRRVVGIVAGLRPMKRHKTFIRAARRVLDADPNVHFVIVGDGSLRGGLEALTTDLGINGRVHFVGWQGDVYPFLSIFDIGVNCSANEGLSNAIMEYMAYGVPCIVSRAGGNEELIENGVNGYTFELDNDTELARLTVSLLEDTKKQEEFAAESRRIIRNEFGIDRMVHNYDSYFERILANSSFGAQVGSK